MSAFLEELARSAHGLATHTLVLPTPRACLFFDKHYAELFGIRPDFEVKDWSTFLASHSEFRHADKLTLVFELFKQYPREEKPDLDLFYTWAEIIINDFSETDSNLIEPDAIFANIEEWQKYADPPSSYLDEADDYRRFWEVLGKENKELKKRFIENWGTLARLYRNFSDSLRQHRWAYYGMKVREVCQKIDDESLPVKHPHWFAGFSRLSKGEAKIVNHFVAKDGKFIYDGDEHCVKNLYHDAGLGYRNLKKQGVEPTVFWADTTTEKSMEFVGAPLRIGQTGALGQYLYELGNVPDWEKTAVVLPDESALDAVIDSLPDNIPVVNITGGYSIVRHPLWTITEKLLDLQTSAKLSETGAPEFYFPDVQFLLSHPYLSASAPESVAKLSQSLLISRVVYPKVSYLADPKHKLPPVYSAMFRRVRDVAQWNGYLLNVYAEILADVSKNADNENLVENEIVYFYYTAAKQMAALCQRYPELMTFSLWRKIFRRFLRTTQLPFEGEPVEGMQIIGLKETAALNFETVFFLNANEDVLPASGFPATFIPPQIRSAFGLPYTREWQSDFSYSVYRLISRAKNVVFFFNNVPGEGAEHGKEVSRFVRQIRHDYAKKNPRVRVSQTAFESRSERAIIEPINAEIDDDVRKKLAAYLSDSDSKAYFSPSAITQFLGCKLRFYFQNLLKIREPDEFSKTLEHDELGRILHKTLELFYEGNLDETKAGSPDGYVKRYGRKIEPAALERHFSELDGFISAAMHAENINEYDMRSGENWLRFNVVSEMARQIVLTDVRDAKVFNDMRILATEKEVRSEIMFQVGDKNLSVKIGGTLDRIDKRDGKYYILDYKTGRKRLDVNYKQSNNRFTFDAYPLQGLIYAQMFQENMKRSGVECPPPKVGFYMPALGRDILRLLPDEHFVSDEKRPAPFLVIRELLSDVFTEMYSDAFVFSQTDKHKECTYCPYKHICFRA